MRLDSGGWWLRHAPALVTLTPPPSRGTPPFLSCGVVSSLARVAQAGRHPLPRFAPPYPPPAPSLSFVMEAAAAAAAAAAATAATHPTYGVTEPISLAPPEPLDAQLSVDLDVALRAAHLYECPAETAYRETVLAKLSRLVSTWVYRVSLAQGLSPDAAATTGARILTFGSYRLGVSGPGADIDTLAVAPRHVDRRRDVFGMYEAGVVPPPRENVLVEMLRDDPDASEIVAVAEAYVPVIKFVYGGVEIDLLVACLQLEVLPPSLDILDDGIDPSQLGRWHPALHQWRPCHRRHPPPRAPHP